MNPLLTQLDLAAIAPLLILLAGVMVLLLVESFAEISAKKLAAPLTLITLMIALGAAFYIPTSDHSLLTRWLRFDLLAQFFTVFFLLIGVATTFLTISFFKRFEATHGEYYFLLLSSLIGLILIGSAADFLTFFIGLETLSLSLYILCGYMKKWKLSHEAAIKYFLIGALAAAILLYGIALIYGAIGTTNFSSMLKAYKEIDTLAGTTLFLSGIALVTVGIAFKATVVPFHTWAPDVYAGAPTPVVAFMSTGTKVGAFAAFSVIFLSILPNFHPIWNECIALLAYPTIIFSNIVALRQKTLRRFFAYSGISHAGFLLIPLAAGSPQALSALLFYLVVYVTATIGAFSVLAFLDDGEQDIPIDNLKGLFYRSPVLAGIMVLSLLTLAGLPPTAGFLAKFYIFKVAFEAGYYGIVFVGLIMTVVSAFYYIQIAIMLFSERPQEGEEENKILPKREWSINTVAVITLIGLVVLSCYPEPMLSYITAIQEEVSKTTKQ